MSQYKIVKEIILELQSNDLITSELIKNLKDITTCKRYGIQTKYPVFIINGQNEFDDLDHRRYSNSFLILFNEEQLLLTNDWYPKKVEAFIMFLNRYHNTSIELKIPSRKNTGKTFVSEVFPMQVPKSKKIKYKGVFKMPNAVTIMGRSSSITNSFINGIIPLIDPSEEDIEKVFEIFKMSSEDIRCVYCGDKSSEWDHLLPIIKDKKPTGFISEIQNLVPACGKCNQSKGNQNWNDWIKGDAKQSPFTREVEGLDQKISYLLEFEKWKTTTNIDFREIIGIEKWDEYENSYNKIILAMKEAQIISSEIKEIVKNNNYI
ncbi:MAG: HNH endonuclease [Flavobacteriaceae bacterium]|nr:HNH endonuclease [Flavobacteriaceae bacterium]